MLTVLRSFFTRPPPPYPPSLGSITLPITLTLSLSPEPGAHNPTHNPNPIPPSLGPITLTLSLSPEPGAQLGGNRFLLRPTAYCLQLAACLPLAAHLQEGACKSRMTRRVSPAESNPNPNSNPDPNRSERSAGPESRPHLPPPYLCRHPFRPHPPPRPRPCYRYLYPPAGYSY